MHFSFLFLVHSQYNVRELALAYGPPLITISDPACAQAVHNRLGLPDDTKWDFVIIQALKHDALHICNPRLPGMNWNIEVLSMLSRFTDVLEEQIRVLYHATKVVYLGGGYMDSAYKLPYRITPSSKASEVGPRGLFW